MKQDDILYLTNEMKNEKIWSEMIAKMRSGDSSVKNLRAVQLIKKSMDTQDKTLEEILSALDFIKRNSENPLLAFKELLSAYQLSEEVEILLSDLVREPKAGKLRFFVNRTCEIHVGKCMIKLNLPEEFENFIIFEKEMIRDCKDCVMAKILNFLTGNKNKINRVIFEQE